VSASRRQSESTADYAARPDIDVVREALDADYEILEELGRGGMATVYRARERQLGREVALKVLPFRLSHDKELVARFEREARTAALLEHAHIVPIHRVGRSGPVIYFAMQLLRGDSLGSRMRKEGSIPADQLRRILVETASALGHAHASGIVHRDVKPDNILLDTTGRCMVTDFGIARSTSDAHLTASGMSMGTPRYMSPEQARATSDVDGRSDLYSLGVVGYECLTGRAPFEGTDPMAIMFGHVQLPLPVPTIATRGAADERELYAVIERLLAKQPASRYQTAEELIEALTSGSSGRRRALARAAAEARYGPVATPPQSAAALDSALEAGVDLIRRQKPHLAAGMAVGQRFLAAAGPRVQSAASRVAALGRRGAARSAAAALPPLRVMGPFARRHSRKLAIVGIAGAALIGGGWYAAQATSAPRGRCASLVAEGRAARFTVLVERVAPVARGSAVELYYDVCGIAPGPFRTRVTLTRPASGFQRLMRNAVEPIAVTYDENAGRGAVRRHRSIKLGDRPAGTYTLAIVVTDESGRRREKFQAVEVRDR
jgi:tRNA A-37 threonylcarbamoyl transferase component Bud32